MRAGWVLGILFVAVLGVAGIFQIGLFDGQSATGQEMITAPASSEDIFTTSAGWRYQRGQPNHWKYLIMNR